MPDSAEILLVSDIHHASAGELARHYPELAVIKKWWLRRLVHCYRHYIWMREPFDYNPLFERFLASAADAQFVVANGDFSCDSAFIGVSDPPSLDSARYALGKLRARFGASFLATVGDHELGKTSLFGGVGGMRLASWDVATVNLGLAPFWTATWDRYELMGVASSLLALPVYAGEALPTELARWEQLRAAHVQDIATAFSNLDKQQRVLLFCHDPTALPFLGGIDEVRSRFGQIEQTWLGHLHTKLVWWPSRVLAGMPTISFMGNSIRRMSHALNQGRHWRPFKPRLCPALAGIQLLNDGGYYRLRLSANPERPVQARFVPMKRR